MQSPKPSNSENQKRLKYYFDEAQRWVRIVCKDFRRRLHGAKFVVELIGVIVLICYTYWTRQIFLDATRPVVAIRNLDPSGLRLRRIAQLG
jgi:hypothetical protein